MYAAKFVFRQHRRDAAFDRLDDAILAAARSHPGYRRREAWRNEDGDVAVIYYWESLEALREFARDPVHREAKARYDEWYEGYRVEIARIVRSYGDGFYEAHEDAEPAP